VLHGFPGEKGNNGKINLFGLFIVLFWEFFAETFEVLPPHAVGTGISIMGKFQLTEIVPTTSR
jgi:hypothetical protein